MLSRFRNIAAGALILGTTAFAAPAVLAADNDDDLGAYLYETSCDDLDTNAIVDDIGDLDVDNRASKEWDRLSNGQDAPDKLWVEDEDLANMTVDDLVANPHAIAVHASDSKDADVIACGDITGTPENGTLLIALSEVDDSGFEGRAHFSPDHDDDDDNELEVTVGIWAAGDVAPLASPIAGTPVS